MYVFSLSIMQCSSWCVFALHTYPCAPCTFIIYTFCSLTFIIYSLASNSSASQHRLCFPVVQAYSSWFPDSGAINHLTNVVPAPQVTTSYTVPGKVLVVNESYLQIFVICSSVVPTDNKHLMLNNMLYTLCVTKKFLCVCQFSKDNQVYIEFHACYCLIRESISHRVLLKGFEYGGLYKLICLVFLL